MLIWLMGPEKTLRKNHQAQSPMLQTAVSTPLSNRSFSLLKTFLDMLLIFIDFQDLKSWFYIW